MADGVLSIYNIFHTTPSLLHLQMWRWLQLLYLTGSTWDQNVFLVSWTNQSILGGKLQTFLGTKIKKSKILCSAQKTTGLHHFFRFFQKVEILLHRGIKILFLKKLNQKPFTARRPCGFVGKYCTKMFAKSK